LGFREQNQEQKQIQKRFANSERRFASGEVKAKAKAEANGKTRKWEL